MYCGSTAYGKGCIYSPHKTHMHTDDHLKCIYCGSTTLGLGCLYNPFGRQHIRGSDYNNMMRESVHKSFTLGLLISRLQEEIQSTEAYKLGIIDENMNIKRPLMTEEDRSAYTAADHYIYKLRKFIGESKLQMLNTSLIIEKSLTPKTEKFNPAHYEREQAFKHRIHSLVESFHDILKEAQAKDVPFADIEKHFIDAVIQKK